MKTTHSKQTKNQTEIPIPKRPKKQSAPSSMKNQKDASSLKNKTHSIKSYQALIETQRIHFAQNLATLLKSGVPLAQSLEVLALQEKHQTYREIIASLAQSVDQGHTLSFALKQFPKAFETLFIKMVEAGETSGQLDDSLNRIARFKEKRIRIKTKIKTSMTYPLIVMAVSLALITLLITFVIPRFQLIYSDILKDAPLPTLTKLILSISNIAQAGLFLWIPLILISILAFKLFKAKQRNSSWLHRNLLKIPKIGDLIMKINIMLFTQTLGPLLKAGLPTLEAFQLSRTTLLNKHILKTLGLAKNRLESGASLAQALEQETDFPPMLSCMIGVAEKSETLPEALEFINERYEVEIQDELAQLVALLEPFLILLLALVVGTVVIALFLPIVQIIGNLAAA